MLLKIIKLSVFCICLFNSSYIKADSFFEPVNSTVCEEKKAGISQVDIRFDAYDKATLQAIKNNQYVKNKAQNIDDHQYNIIAYKISDTVLSDVNIKTIQDDDEKVCIELFGIINKKEVDLIVVLYKDRLLRFGFELVEYFAKLNNVNIEVLDKIDKTQDQELVEDLVQIITVFSCKIQGKRKKTKDLMNEFSQKLEEIND